MSPLFVYNNTTSVYFESKHCTCCGNIYLHNILILIESCFCQQLEVNRLILSAWQKICIPEMMTSSGILTKNKGKYDNVYYQESFSVHFVVNIVPRDSQDNYFFVRKKHITPFEL